ncbi:metallophosphoesterase family protein [Paenibacillus nasutitermitis]|uniref:Phosphohydrolase n=1 Tax=Paenibacillus nasutitermitis TaxID=1652958 RepID=A0A916ZCA6_9BACL|nr:metallophosphoesterase family protein [Paenibacillus nasutitermitis]GGD87294.1 phosphohydrolase [Paenibacillus nasutitermitis]
MNRNVKFRGDGSFKILQLTDMHIGGDSNNAKDLKTIALTERLIAGEKPDLIVFTGDLISSLGVQDPAAALRRAIAPAVRSGIPWAHIFGNHDSEENVTREELMEVSREQSGCLSEAGPEDINGTGNYILTIESGKSSSAAAVLYFLDSGAMAPESIGGYEWIHTDQVNWYNEQSLRLQNEHGSLPALAFFHIPLPEYDDVWQHGQVSGNKYEEVCCPKLNSGLFAAMAERGDVAGTFAGHDHDNDYCGTLHGIRLCFGRVTGYNTYGSLERGARIIRLQEGERHFDTWISLG